MPPDHYHHVSDQLQVGVLLKTYVGVSATALNSGNVTSQQIAQGLANDIMNCTNQLNAGNWSGAMAAVGK
jgi:hypothetical protein